MVFERGCIALAKKSYQTLYDFGNYVHFRIRFLLFYRVRQLTQIVANKNFRSASDIVIKLNGLGISIAGYGKPSVKLTNLKLMAPEKI